MRNAVMGCLAKLLLYWICHNSRSSSEGVIMNIPIKKQKNNKEEKQIRKLMWMVFLGMIFSLLIIYAPHPCASYGGNGGGGGEECCPEVYIAPATKNAYPGDTFTVDVWTDSGSDCPVKAAEYSLTWDPTALDFVDCSYIGGYGTPSQILTIPVEQEGNFLYAISRVETAGNPAAPVDCHVLTLAFQVLQTATPGDYTIYADVQVVDGNNVGYDCVANEDCVVTVLPEKAQGHGECVYTPNYWL